jgi:hypothetical protein
MELHMGRTVMRLLSWVLVIAIGLVTRQVAAAPAQHVFALIVTNNKSVTLAQPDLQYADDDGARYFQLLCSVAAEPDVVLLTSFDRATAAIYPDLSRVTRAPTRAQVQVASKLFGDAVEQARARGELTTFYFIYAGHGDIDEGRGYIELEDGRIDGRFIEQEVLDRVPANTKHLVLDSCNSFFVINPRKPGGRRWATPKDMALGFSARHPEVGLFLSTNSDSEVFEWSAIESGVFSHEVRSGLAGGADVNGDGSISYSELAGFIQVANAGIAREVLRPQLFYRGPRGDANAPLFPNAQINGRHITLAKPASRLWIKSASGERVLDVHKEPGLLNLVIPGATDQELFVYEQQQDPLGQHAPTVLERRVAPGQDAVQLASLEVHDPLVAQRGDRLFGSLFAKPYGPLAYAQYLQTSAAAPEPVYGLTQADLARMHNYLSAMADQDRSTRLGFGVGTIGLGSFATAVGVGLALDKEDRRQYPAAIGIAGGVGLGLIGGGLYLTLTRSSGEEALITFEHELANSKGNGSWAFVKTEEWLTKMAARERAVRKTWFWMFEGAGLALGTLATLNALYPDPKVENRAMGPALLYTEAAYFMVCGVLLSVQDTPTERMLNLYHQDPAIKLHLGAVATPGGGAVGIFGLF